MLKRVLIALSLCAVICFLSAFSINLTNALSFDNVKLKVNSPFVDEQEPELYIDENMPTTMSIVFNGKEYKTNYEGTRYWHQYVADGKHKFFLDINTGEFHSYAYYDYKCESDLNLTEESYVEQAKSLLMQYVDIKQYEVEINDAGANGCRLTFTRWLGDVELPGLYTVKIACDGTVVSCSIAKEETLAITPEIEEKIKFLTSSQAEKMVLDKAEETNSADLAPFYIKSKYASQDSDGNISVSFTVGSQSEFWKDFQLPYIVLTYEEEIKGR